MGSKVIQVQLGDDEPVRLALSMEDALLHVHKAMSRDRWLSGARLRESAKAAVADFAYLGDAAPNLAHVLFRRAGEDVDPAVVTIHDAQAPAGDDSVRLVSVMATERAPSLELLAALVDTVGSGEDAEAVAGKLERVMRSFGPLKSGSGNPASGLARLRDWQNAFGHPEGHPLDIVPDFVPGESATDVLASIPGAAVERFRSLVATLTPPTAPRP